jgi:hypothetical protein
MRRPLSLLVKWVHTRVESAQCTSSTAQHQQLYLKNNHSPSTVPLSLAQLSSPTPSTPTHTQRISIFSPQIVHFPLQSLIYCTINFNFINNCSLSDFPLEKARSLSPLTSLQRDKARGRERWSAIAI